MEAYYPSQHTMSPEFPLSQPPNCPLSICTNTARRTTVDDRKHSQNAKRPYYFCQAGHKWKFVTWDDVLGISDHTWATRLNGRIFPQTFERFKNIANG
ncbi:Retrovirus-related Pol polyprotein from transposon TNT 1-94 [Fusarium oxysporum f. sp. albedinis]|nr:Retrovirus-related Pol polyprotein from transposon TNT 1-94 [Fusarium oxysporum f. sp. albedinis]